MIRRPPSLIRRVRGFTLLEVALIVAIIGMMMLIFIGYLITPKEKPQLPPVEARKLITPVPGVIPGPPPGTTIEITPGVTPAER